jgi:hypothetical protein
MNETSQTHSTTDTLGLDWDGVISHFPREMKILASKFSRTVVITLNRSVTYILAAETLRNAEVHVEICPDDRRDDYAAWKAEMCLKHNVTLLLDDDGYVVIECRSREIPALAINAAFVQMMLYPSEF